MCASDAAPLSQSAKPKLLDQVGDRCRLRHLALSTEHSYVGWIRRFILLHHKRHPLEMGAKEAKDLRTTQIYTHVLKLNGFAVRSPADQFPRDFRQPGQS